MSNDNISMNAKEKRAFKGKGEGFGVGLRVCCQMANTDCPRSARG